MKIALPSSMLTWRELILNPTSSPPSLSVSSCASATSCITISRSDQDSIVRQKRSDDCRTAFCASFSFKWRSGASARDQTQVGCDPLSAEAEGMDTADLSAIDALLQLQTRCWPASAPDPLLA
jgi:hypothetical protein